MVLPAQCGIWLARPVRPKDLADQTARRLLRLRAVVHRQLYSTTLHCRSHEHHARCFWLWTAPLGKLFDLVQPCATKYCARPRLLRYIYIYTYEAVRACVSVVASSHFSTIIVYVWTRYTSIPSRTDSHVVDSFWWRPPIWLHRVQLWQFPCLAPMTRFNPTFVCLFVCLLFAQMTRKCVCRGSHAG